MIEFLEPGIAEWVGGPVYGNQDRGVAPGGAMDQFALACGNLLLGNGETEKALEILTPPVFRFSEPVWFTVTGAAWTSLKLSGERALAHAEVYRAEKGDVLTFGEKRYGFRSCLCLRPVGKSPGRGPEGRRRGDFKTMASWPDSQGKIRVVEGPEFELLENPTAFFNQRFRVGQNSSAMGLRLEPREETLRLLSKTNMISQPVSDGTVQLTPDGPVILLRRRQTIGGYPRIFNVITADLDTLAQIGPMETLAFRKVNLDEALAVLEKRRDDLRRLREGLS